MTNTPTGYEALLENPDQINAEDVRRLRRDVFQDGIVTRTEADGVFGLNDAITRKCSEWNVFFIEAMTDFVVHQAEPRGYVSVENADWLINSISHDGVVDSATELELLVKVMAKSFSCPERLVSFALAQVKYAVVEGRGPLANSASLTPGVIGEAEVELLRTILFAAGGENGLSISRMEAEMLFDLNEATDPERNAPSWQQLFVRANANYLMAAAGRQAPSRDQALARDEWLEDTETDVGGFLLNTLSGFGKVFSRDFFDDVFTDAHVQMERAWKKRNEEVAIANHRSEIIDSDEADWIINRVSKDGVTDPNEKALYEFLRAESHSVDPSLQRFFKDKVA